MKQYMLDDKPPSYESLYQPTAPPLPSQLNHHPLPPLPNAPMINEVFGTGFSGCNPFCAPGTSSRNSYESISTSSQPYPSELSATQDHIPEAHRKGVLWSGSGVQTLDGGAKKIHSEIIGSLTAGAMTIRTAGNKTIETLTIQLDVFLVHVPDDEIVLTTEKSGDSYKYLLKTPKSLGFKKKVRAYWLITLPDHWMQPERLSANLINSSIIGMVGLRDMFIGELDMRTTNGPIQFQTANANNLNFQTTNAPIEILSGNADEIRVETTNGSVKGSLMGKDFIKVKTSNSAIELDAKANDVSVTTTNNHIKAIITASKYATVQSSSGYLDVQVRCPKIKVTTTNAPISGTINGKDVSIKTTNAKIQSITVTGEDIKAQTSNARIEGDFVASKVIVLKTSNSTIESNCRVEEVGGDISITTSNGMVSGSYEAYGGDIDITTSNAKIIPSKLVGKRIRLTTSKSTIRADATIGQSIKATTNHSNIELNLGLDDSDKKIDVSAETSHSAINIRLPDTVVGTFDVNTSHRLASVEAPNALNIVLDKSEKDVKVGRKVPEKSRSGYRDGKVQIRTSHGEASLIFI